MDTKNALLNQYRELAHRSFTIAHRNAVTSEDAQVATPQQLDDLLLRLDAIKDVRAIVVGVVTDHVCPHGNITGPRLEMLGMGTVELMSATATVVAAELESSDENAAYFRDPNGFSFRQPTPEFTARDSVREAVAALDPEDVLLLSMLLGVRRSI